MLFTDSKLSCTAIFLQILARHGEDIEADKWIMLIHDLASCVAIKRPKEVNLYWSRSLA